MADEKKQEQHDESRRKFLKNSGLVVGGVIGGGLLGTFVDNPFKQEDGANNNDSAKEEKSYTETRMFFKRYEDFAVLEAATERIYPEDDNGPGAIALGVPFFIDKQLAGSYGSNKYDYMKGPVQEVEVKSSYQTLMTRGEVFIEGVRKLNEESKSKHDAPFYELEGDVQDELLTAMSEDKIELNGVAAHTFFSLLRSMTIEGAYADPLYGGNKDMKGWIMKEHPGIRVAYADIIEEEEFQVLDQMSLKDYQR